MAACVKHRYLPFIQLGNTFLYLRLQGIRQAKASNDNNGDTWSCVGASSAPAVMMGLFVLFQHRLAPKTMQQIEQQAHTGNGPAGGQMEDSTVCRGLVGASLVASSCISVMHEIFFFPASCLFLSFPVFSAHAAVVFIFLRISTTDVDIVFAVCVSRQSCYS